MNAIFEKHNSMRHYCVQRLDALRRLDTWQAWVTAHFFYPLLYEIEAFVAADFQSLDELNAFLELAVNGALQRSLDKNVEDYAHLLRRNQTSLEDIYEQLSAAHKDVLALVRLDPPPSAPAVHYRRALTKAALTAIWTAFDQHRRELGSGSLYRADDLWLQDLVRMLASRGVTRLYQLYSGAYIGYELDVAWLYPMFCYDDTYWTAPDFTWYVYGEGHGYPQLGGAAWELLAK
jgi:hypothetical protein